MSLIDTNDLLNGLVLTHYSFPEVPVELFGLETGLRRIELFVQAAHRRTPFTI
jgi:hypothetical protein